jgi:hypothetical protein
MNELRTPGTTNPPLMVLQYTPRGVGGPEISRAAKEVARYHAADAGQAERHQALTEALAAFLVRICECCPPGAERSTAISRAREAKMWASCAIALEPSR